MRQRRGRRERVPQETSEPGASQPADEPTTTPQPPVDTRFEPYESGPSSQPLSSQPPSPSALYGPLPYQGQSSPPQPPQPYQPPQSYEQPRPYQQPDSYQPPQPYQQPQPYQPPQPGPAPDRSGSREIDQPRWQHEPPSPGYGTEPEPGIRPEPGYDVPPGPGHLAGEEPSQPFDVWQPYQDRLADPGSYGQGNGWQAQEPGPASGPQEYGQWLDYGQPPPQGSYEQRQAYPDPADPGERSYRGGQYDPLSASQWPPPGEAASYPPPPAYPSSANGAQVDSGPANSGPADSGPADSAEEPFDFESFYRPLPSPAGAGNPPPGGLLPPVQPAFQVVAPQAAAPQVASVPPGQDSPDQNQGLGLGQPARRRRRRRVIAVVVTVLVLVLGAAGTGGGYLLLRTQGSPRQTAISYLSAWRRQDYAAMKQVSLNVPGSGLQTALTSVSSQLGVKHMSLRLGQVAIAGNAATALFTVTDDLAGGHVWTYQDKLPLRVKNRHWWVVWSPATIYPGLRAGERFVLSAQWPARGQIVAADGTVLSSPVAVNESGSLALLTGYVGTATAAQAKKLGAPYRKGDEIGESGIEEQYQNRLAGRPALIVKLEGPGHKVDRTAMKFPAKPGKNVETSIEMSDQLAASAAVSTAKTNKPIDMVVIQPSTGKVLAVVERPGGFDRALDGIFPPGSTFKIITASALVNAGLTTSTTVQCPSQVTIDGRVFHNDDNEHYGTISFLTAFAVSCNSTFVQLATQKLSGASLAAMAKTFGLNATPKLGLPATLGQFKTPLDPVDLAADAFGQGLDLVNPLSQATVAAAIEDGNWRPPLLVTSPKVHQVAKPHAISPAILDALRPMMRAVVTSGTASGVGFGPDVYGKTGTAQYGTGPKLQSHGWFIGYEGDIAFAVIVEGGGYGADSAGPIANAFLRRI